MKNFIVLLSVYFLSWITSVNPTVFAQQCPQQDQEDSVISVLEKQGFMIVEKYLVDVKSKREVKENSSYSYMFSKGSSYIIHIVNPPDYKQGDFVISLFDKNDLYIAGTCRENMNKYYDKFIFNCRTTGTYNLQYFVNKKKFCGQILVGLKNKPSVTKPTPPKPPAAKKPKAAKPKKS